MSNYSGVLRFLVLSRRAGLDAPVEAPTALAQIVRCALKRISFFWENDAGMSMKIKDQSRKPAVEAEMYMKTKVLIYI